MPVCYHCGEEIFGEPYHCDQCGQNYCSLHKDQINHDCNIVKESLGFSQQYQPVTPAYQPSTPSYMPVPHDAPRVQDQINQQQSAGRQFQQQYGSAVSSGSDVRGTTDGSFTWYHQEKFIPENAFDPDSGIAFKGIMLPYKSEFLHLLIGCSLIFIIGLLTFYNPESQAQFEKMGYGWVIFMLAGFYTTAFLFHEFGHRQVAKHFDLQTKFRLLTFGMILTAVSIITSLMSLLTNSIALPALALPGAVVVLGLDKIDNRTGWCKAAGPLVNLVYGSILLIISFMMPRTLYPLNAFIGLAASINFMLGLFNMLPIGILDGQNIFKWSKKMYFFLVIALLILLIIFYINYLNFEISLYIPEESKI